MLTQKDFRNLLAPIIKLDINNFNAEFGEDKDSALAHMLAKQTSMILQTIGKDLDMRDRIIEKALASLAALEDKVKALDQTGSVKLC